MWVCCTYSNMISNCPHYLDLLKHMTIHLNGVICCFIAHSLCVPKLYFLKARNFLMFQGWLFFAENVVALISSFSKFPQTILPFFPPRGLLEKRIRSFSKCTSKCEVDCFLSYLLWGLNLSDLIEKYLVLSFYVCNKKFDGILI